MKFESQLSVESPPFREIAVAELADNQLLYNEVQEFLANAAYDQAHRHEEIDVDTSQKLMWWITSGLAAKYGDWVVDHKAEVLDLSSEENRIEFLENLDDNMTEH